MTLQELEDGFPNGFHDAMLLRVAFDFTNMTCDLVIDVNDNDPDPDVSAIASVRLTGLAFACLTPPGAEMLPLQEGPMDIQIVDTNESILPGYAKSRERLPAGVFFCSLFLFPNFELHLAAENAQLISVEKIASI